MTRWPPRQPGGHRRGRDDTLPALTGIRIEIQGDTLTLVATDRYRLAVRELRWNPAQPDLSTALLVPARVLGDARALTSGAEVSISLGGDGLIGFAGPAADHHPAAVDDTPVTPRCCERVQRTAELVAGPSPSGQAVVLVADGTPRTARPRARASSCSRPARRRGAGGGDHRGGVRRRGPPDRVQPAVLLDSIGAMDSDTAGISFTSPTKPAVIAGKTEREPDSG